MDKKETVKSLLKEGVLIPPEILEKINEENKDEILRELREKRSGIETEGKIVVESTEPKEIEKISVEDVVNHQNRKYEVLKNTLLKKIQAVSINKGKKTFSEVYIIGRVVEIGERGFMAEDITGKVEVVTKETPEPGDVVGLKGVFKENQFFPKEIIYPDIPLNRGQQDLKLKLLLTTKVTGEMEKLDGFFILCPDPEHKTDRENVITKISNPGWVGFSQEGEKTTVFIYKPDKPIEENDAVKFLKKRAIPNKNTVDTNTNYLMEDAPNIFWLPGNGKNWTRNYKGVVVISNDDLSFVSYDMGENRVKFEKI